MPFFCFSIIIQPSVTRYVSPPHFQSSVWILSDSLSLVLTADAWVRHAQRSQLVNVMLYDGIGFNLCQKIQVLCYRGGCTAMYCDAPLVSDETIKTKTETAKCFTVLFMSRWIVFFCHSSFFGDIVLNTSLFLQNILWKVIFCKISI